MIENFEDGEGQVLTEGNNENIERLGLHSEGGENLVVLEGEKGEWRQGQLLRANEQFDD
jgi:hypothetical protein